jgi:hypothetical protein
MANDPALRRLIDLPGIADLEYQALLKPRYTEIEGRAEFLEIDEVSRANFGLTADEAEDVDLPADWDKIERKPDRDQVAAFEAAGWDVTDKRRPLRMLGQFKLQLWLAIRGVAGQLPYQAPPDDWKPDDSDPFRSSLAIEAAAFLRDRRKR